MPSDKPARRPEDIIENAQAIRRYVTGLDVTAFERDQKTYDAAERCLERIGEAAAKLGDLAPTLVPGQPWHEIRALGNRLRHEYEPSGKIASGTSYKSTFRRWCVACEHALQRLREGQMGL